MNDTNTASRPKVPADVAREIASTIFSQLGGMNRLVAMTGAKNFAFNAKDDGTVAASFRIGRNAKGVNHVEIVLNGLDLYDVTFRRIHGTKVTVKAETSNAYGDMLKDLFESATGMYLTF